MKAAFPVCTEGDALLRPRAEADGVRELPAGQFQSHRMAGTARGHRGEGHMRPGAERRAEGPAHERVDDLDLFGRNAEDQGNGVALVADPL